MRHPRFYAFLFAIGLLILHNNFWNWHANLHLIFGIFPVDLVYRVLWVVAASLVLWFSIRAFWGKPE